MRKPVLWPLEKNIVVLFEHVTILTEVYDGLWIVPRSSCAFQDDDTCWSQRFGFDLRWMTAQTTTYCM